MVEQGRKPILWLLILPAIPKKEGTGEAHRAVAREGFEVKVIPNGHSRLLEKDIEGIATQKITRAEAPTFHSA